MYGVNALLPFIAFFNKKIALGVAGRRKAIATLIAHIDTSKPTIWMHAASLGEYEQGLPVMEALQQQYPTHQWVVSFFSPSGFEVKKDKTGATTVVYLPLDTPSNARKFLDAAQPEMALFIKYEFWPNYLTELQKRKIRTFLISGVFRESQPFFKGFGKWMTTSLQSFEYFFLQDKSSEAALQKLGFLNHTISGDTRFDRVSHQIEIDNTLDFIAAFKQDALCIVCGSTWPEDDTVITSYINTSDTNVKFIIAPHEIKPEKIAALENALAVRAIRYSSYTDQGLKDAQVFIIDTIGILNKIYSYADIAYVGGAMGTTGLHNILEPATFGVPIVTGTNFEKFPEAKKLQQLAGLYAVNDPEAFTTIVDKLVTDQNFRHKTGMIAGHFINSNTGATKTVLDYLKTTPK